MKPENPMKRVDRARKAIWAAEAELEKAMQAAFPPGTQARYSQGAYTVNCTVIGVWGDRVKILGASGKEYWINGYRLRKGEQ